MALESKGVPVERITFRVTLQPRTMGFARKLTIEDVYRAVSELKERHPSLYVIGGGPPSFVVYAEGIRKNVITSEEELGRYARSPATKDLGVFYSNPTTRGAAMGNSRIEFKNHDGSVRGALRIRDRFPGVKPIFEMGLGFMLSVFAVMLYAKQALAGPMLTAYKIALGVCILIVMDGYRGIRNNNLARIQFDVDVSDEEMYLAMSTSLDRIRL